MKTRLFLIFVVFAVMSVRAEVIPGYVLVDGTPAPAEYTLLSDGTVGLGSGQNASISQYTTGRITVPSAVKSGSKTFADIFFVINNQNVKFQFFSSPSYSIERRSFCGTGSEIVKIVPSPGKDLTSISPADSFIIL